MFVKDWMNREVITVAVDAPLLDAVHLMRDNNIRQLPVVKGDRLAGIITEKDIKEFSPSRASTLDIYEMHAVLARTEVKEVMTSQVVTARPDDPIEKVALILRDRRFGGLPVVDFQNKLVGIITSVDLFDVFVEAMGMRTPGSRVSIEVEDRPGAIAEMTQVFKAYDINIVSLATFFLKGEDRRRREVVYRIASANPGNIDRAVEELKKRQFKVTSFLNSDRLMVLER